MEVCIIGAGFSGIATAKSCLSHGITPYILEKQPLSGGIWRAFPNANGVWDSLQANTSKYLSAFSDMPFPPDCPDFPSGAQFLQYLESYIAKHDLAQYIHYNCEVIFLDKLEDTYIVRWKSAETITEKVFQGVAIASGKFTSEHNPFDRESLGKFEGEVLYGGYYREPSIFEGKKVVVIGNSFSAIDIAADAAERATSLTQIVRRDVLFVTRHANGLPVDFEMFPLKRPFEASLVPKIEESAAFGRMFINILRNIPILQDVCWLDEASLDREFFRLTVYSEKYINALHNKIINYIKGNATELYERGVVLADGTRIEADLIVLGTGHRCEYPFLSKEIKRIIQYNPDERLLARVLYRSILHPDLQRLSFSGTFEGPYTGRFELPAEIGVRFIAGKLKISREEMEQGVRDEEYVRTLTKHGLAFAYDFGSYMHECCRILEIEFDREFIEGELGFGKGPVLPFFFNLKTKEQREICKRAVEEIKRKFPSFEFS